MNTMESVLVSGAEHALFEQLIISGMKGSPEMDEKKQYVDPSIRALFVGFVWGHVAGFSQGTHAARETFDEQFKAAADTAYFAPAEVGTSAGLMGLDSLMKASLEDIQAMLQPGNASDIDLQISKFAHLLPALLKGLAPELQQAS